MKASEKKQQERLEEIAQSIEAIVPISDDEKGDTILQKDPNVELTKIQMMIGLAIPPYDGVISQVTNYDHPLQTLGITADLTELDIMRSLGLPEGIYTILKGSSYVDDKGNIKINNTGFNGMLRARMGLVYPGIDGMLFHPREQIFRTTRPSKDDRKKDKSWFNKLFGGGGE